MIPAGSPAWKPPATLGLVTRWSMAESSPSDQRPKLSPTSAFRSMPTIVTEPDALMSDPRRRILVVLFHDVAEASAEVSGTASRTAKVRRVAEALAISPADGPETVRTVVAWLRGELRQRRTGLGWTSVRDLPAPAPAPSLTVVEVDETFARAAGLSGTGSQTERRALLAGLAARATASEQR